MTDWRFTVFPTVLDRTDLFLFDNETVCHGIVHVIPGELFIMMAGVDTGGWRWCWRW